MAFAFLLHVLSAVIWVGGMFFAYVCLRPVAASVLPPPQRLTLWAQVFERFFPWVWAAVVLLLATGLWMVFGFYGGMKQVGVHVHVMLLLGIIMMLIFGHVYFAPFRRLRQAVQAENWPEGGNRLGQIRKLIAVNLTLGLLLVVIATGGKYLAGLF